MLADGRNKEECPQNHMLSLFYLAQVLAHLGEPAQAAQCIQATLQLQLRAGDYDSVDWATNCLHLSEYLYPPSARRR